MKKISLVDLIGPKHHYNFNLVIYKALEKLNYKLNFFTSEEQYEEIGKYDIDCSVFLNKIGAGKLKNRIISIKNIYHIYDYLKGSKLNIITGFENLSLFLYSQFDEEILGNSYLIMHNNLSNLDKRRNVSILRRLINLSKGIVFLEPVIIKDFLNQYPNFKKYSDKYHYISHPTIYNLELKSYDIQDYIIFPGLISYNKGADLLLNTIKELNYKYKKNILLRGSIEKKISKTFFKELKLLNVKSGFLNKQDYVKKLSQAKFTLLLHNPARFKFRTSGVLYDAISTNTPIICSNHIIFRTLFKKYGKLGYILDSYKVKELKNKLKKAIDIPQKDEEYIKFKENIKACKRQHSLDSIKENLKNIIS